MKTIKWFLRIVGLFHLTVGILGSLSDYFYTKVISVAWQATVNLTPQYAFTTKLMSAYIIAFALNIILVSTNPAKYRIFLLVPIVAISIEFLQTIFRFQQINSDFFISPVHTVMNLVVSIVLIISFSFIYNYLGTKNDQQNS